MNGRTHAICGIIACGALTAMSASNGYKLNVFGEELIPAISIIPSVIGSLGVDIDIDGSKGNKALDKVRTIGKVVGVLLIACACGAVALFTEYKLVAAVAFCILAPLLVFLFRDPARYLTHRGITHTLIVVGLLYLLQISFRDIIWLSSALAGITIGALSHIIADLFNKKGCPLFWPIIPIRIHVASLKAGVGWHNVLFIILWTGGWVFLCYLQYTTGTVGTLAMW